MILGEFPVGPVVRIPGFHCRGLGSVPGQGTEILQVMWRGEKKKNTKNTKSNKQNKQKPP